MSVKKSDTTLLKLIKDAEVIHQEFILQTHTNYTWWII